MKKCFISYNRCMIFVFVAASLTILASREVTGQGIRPSTPDLNRRLENEKLLRDNERLRRGMEADSEALGRTKEERQAVANEAFMRLQVLHNEMMTMVLSSDAPDSKRVTDAVAETMKRAIELRANLVLPKPGKEDKKQKNEDALANDALKDSLALLCAHIKSFVINLNNSPTNDKAGHQARQELEKLITLSDKITATLKTPAR
jgi:hypothetical protein